MGQAEAQEEQQAEPMLSPAKAGHGLQGSGKAGCLVCDTEGRESTRNRWYSDYFLVRRALFVSTANANVVRTVCSVLKGLHNPSKKKSCFSYCLEGFLPKGSEKKSRKNGN